ncbi:hypothetical protein ABZ470_39480 [Streptosporangium sp. NPDC020072]|uniref:hypothetical protein n=1 Tax=Streptosporangium sp. NPDC020072 TaxID=3154788 RepID=UPI00343DE8B5
MWTYRNSRTGQTVELSARSVRLDALDNWLLVGSPAPEPSGEEPALGGEVPPDPPEGGDAAVQRLIVVRPPDNAPKPAWVAYAVALGANETDARALSKAALIEEWGGDDGED